MPRLKIIQFRVDKMGPWDRQDFSTVLLFPVLQLHSIPGDLTREEDANKVVDAAVEKFGTIHILVRMAAIAVVYRNPITPLNSLLLPWKPVAVWRLQWVVNLWQFQLERILKQIMEIVIVTLFSLLRSYC